GVTVTATRVVGHDELRAELLQHGGHLVHRFAPGANERTRMLGGRCARHAGVAPASGTTEEPGAGHPERAQRRGELRDPVPAELVRLIDDEPRELLSEDLPLLAEGARDH